MDKWTQRMRISIYRPPKLARNGSYMVAPVHHFGYSRSSGWWRHRFQIASFSPSTLENSVFKKHRFQIAPLCRAFLNGFVFGDRFRCCSVDDSRIRSKTAPFSFENGLVWMGPKQEEPPPNRSTGNYFSHVLRSNLPTPEKRPKVHFALFLKTRISTNEVHVASSFTASFHPCSLKFGKNVAQ